MNKTGQGARRRAKLERSYYSDLRPEFLEKENLDLDDQGNAIGVDMNNNIWLFDCTEDCVAIASENIPKIIQALQNYQATGSILGKDEDAK